jgi:hypothetical protein
VVSGQWSVASEEALPKSLNPQIPKNPHPPGPNEAYSIMKSSATVAVRAFLMLACLAGIPALAVWGTSWSAVAAKFQNLDWPAAVGWGEASAANANGNRPPAHAGGAAPVAARVSASVAASAADASQDIQQRLKELGTIYYRLESWGNRQQLYRFCCRMAVGEDADYTHYFEAVDADPLRAMRQVLQQVETWKEGGESRAEGGTRKAEDRVLSG